MQVTGLIVWAERWITKNARAQGMLNVFVVEMWDIKLTINDAQLEGNSAENVMGQDISRLYRRQNSGRGRGAGGMRRPDSRRRSGGHHHIRQVEAKDKQSGDCEYVFGIPDYSNVSSDGKISVEVGGCACNNDY
ncbi:unnamed protein product [Pocillopora meandrina]|uniref:Uncharacterized protein n=1 Tax=Pocillopora meandrina TaxID=46732 RepID=A0AAU9XN84_9CNID|nr:unnamed protein product [Pocillopora meandrina]